MATPSPCLTSLRQRANILWSSYPRMSAMKLGVAIVDPLKVSRSGPHRRPRGAAHHGGVLLFERGEAVHSITGGTCDEPSSQRLDRTHDFRANARVGRGSWWNVSGNRDDLLHNHSGDPDLRRE